jgi:chromosome segregation ATPase
MPQQLDSIQRTAVQIVGIVDPSREQLEGHMRKVYDQFKATKDKLDDFGRQFDKMNKDGQDHRLELYGKLKEMSKEEAAVDKVIEDVRKTMKDHQNELGGKFNLILNKQDEHTKQMSGLSSKIDDGKKVDKDLDKVLAMLQDYKKDIHNVVTGLQKNGADLYNANSKEILATMKKALTDYQKDISTNFEKMGSTRLILETVTASLERLQQTIDQVKNCSTENDHNIREIDRTIKKHFIPY